MPVGDFLDFQDAFRQVSSHTLPEFSPEFLELVFHGCTHPLDWIFVPFHIKETVVWKFQLPVIWVFAGFVGFLAGADASAYLARKSNIYQA